MSNCFYEITHSTNHRLCYASTDISFMGYIKGECPSCGRSIFTMEYTKEKYHLVVTGGKLFPDWLQYCGAGEIPTILSERAVDILQKEGITGFSIQCEANLYRKNKNDELVKVTDCPQYYIVNVSGQIDYDYSAMFLKKKKQCSHCNQFNLNRERLYPVYLNEKLWDGSDLCSLLTFQRQKYCTGRFVQVVNKYKLSGFEFHERQGSVCVNPNKKL